MIQFTNGMANGTENLSSGTYVVEDSITLSQDLIIPADVTLIFQGGKFETTEGKEATISGTNTRLVAPICAIFGKGVSVNGTWDIDRAYPQWFEIEKLVKSKDFKELKITENEEKIELETVTEETDYYDWSTPINKAIKMKQVGEVFLKSGEYSVASPIIMNCQIRLVGESSQNKEVKDVLNSENDVERKIMEGGSSRIFPIAEGSETYADEYLLYVNAETDTKSTFPGMEYIVRSTLIKNIHFTNWIKKSFNENLTQKCILAGGGVHLDNLVWSNFLQAVKYTDTYNDGRCITNCVFSTDPQGYKENDKEANVYAFDTGFLGDGMVFELNGISKTASGKALRLSNCGGASIQGNVINGDILIKSSKAVVFNANHCENGIQIKIIDSSVTTNNNYIWKGTKPSYLIYSSGNGDKSVVSLNNDMLIVINNTLDENNDVNKLAEQMKYLAEFDISLDKDTILNIENVFRYDVGTFGFGKMYPFGICLSTYNPGASENEEEFNSLDEFNKYSYMASCKSAILSGYEVRIQGTVKNVNAPSVYSMMLNKGVFWLGKTGLYRYYYQIIWDKDRDIKKTSSPTSTSNSIFNVKRYEYDDEQNLISYDYIEVAKDQDNKGVLLVMNENTNGNCSMVRLFRETTREIDGISKIITEYVDVPVCGTQYLYDNGISVSGYKWKEYNTYLVLQDLCDKNMEMFRIIDGNVECFSKRDNEISLSKGWKRGDVIHYIVDNPLTYIVPDDI